MNYVAIGCITIDNILNAYGEKRLRQFGGNAAYGAMGMRLWQPGQIGMVARAGTDYPEAWLRELTEIGIDTTGVRHVVKRHSMFSGMIYDSNGNRTEVSFDEDNGSEGAELIEGFPYMTPQEVSAAHENFAPTAADIPEDYAGAKAVMIAARHYDRQMEYLDWVRSRCPEAVVVMDTGLDYMRPEKKHLLPPLFSRVDVIVPSWDEIRRLYPEGCTPEEAVLRLRELGAPNAVVKLGGQGCITCDSRGRVRRVPIYRLDRVVDPTGAGDSFCGGLTVGLTETGDLAQAAAYGAVSSSFIISAFGVPGSKNVTRQEALRRRDIIVSQMEAES